MNGWVISVKNPVCPLQINVIKHIAVFNYIKGINLRHLTKITIRSLQLAYQRLNGWLLAMYLSYLKNNQHYQTQDATEIHSAWEWIISGYNCNCDDNTQHFAESDNIQNSEMEMSPGGCQLLSDLWVASTKGSGKVRLDGWEYTGHTL